MSVDLSKLVEDRDVVAPFVERLLLRLAEKYPGVTLADVTLSIDVLRPSGPGVPSDASIRIRRMLSEMDREGVVL